MHQAVETIQKNSQRVDGHLLYKSQYSDVSHIAPVCVEGKSYSPAKVLYAFHANVCPSKVGILRRMCREPACIEHTHYCLERDKLSPNTMDGNNWSETKRTCLLWKLGLLPSTSSDQCIIHPGCKDSWGYGEIWLDNRMYKANVISLRLKIGRPLGHDMQASHICGNPSCVNPTHLIEETGEKNCLRKANAKVNKTQILEIVHLAKKGCSHESIAQQFKIGRSTVSGILQGRTHTGVTGIAKKAVDKHKIEITEDMMDEICERLMIRCKDVIDPVTGQTHRIPQNKSKQSYKSCSMFGVQTKFHILAAIVKCNLRQFPDKRNNLIVLHSCRRTDCCAFDHVTVGTMKQNAQDKIRDGTHQNSAKISPTTAKKIRLEQGTFFDIARKYGVSHAIVANIKKGYSWTALQKPKSSLPAVEAMKFEK